MNNERFGGDFIFWNSVIAEAIIPENFNDEQKMLAKTAQDFVNNEVIPNIKRIDSMEPGLMPSLVKKAGELGLLMGSIPEKYSGLGLNEVSNMILTEKLAVEGSFSVAFGAHTGIGTLPILYFGTEEQKQKYLPLLASGEMIGAYALTETGSGSDALGAKAKAVLENGKYKIDGTKQFISNAGFADVFTVFAKIDGSKFTGFIIEKEDKGVTTGTEEMKMGIKGSSTRQVILDGTEVPEDRVLGRIGRGQLIAFNILYIGRYKLAAGTVGSSKYCLTEAVKYAKARKQFNKFLSEFDMVKEKIALMATKIYSLESMLYELVGNLDKNMAGTSKNDDKYADTFINLVQDYGIECSALKVYGSETLDFVADESLQILGGYGFCQDYPIEKFYRDSRINRIFEGTNEINRLIIGGDIVRKTKKGKLPILDEYKAITATNFSRLSNSDLWAVLDRMKKTLILLAGETITNNPTLISESQCVIRLFSDMIISLYAIDRLLCRRDLLKEQKHTNLSFIEKMCPVLVYSLLPEFEGIAKDVCASLPDSKRVEDTVKNLLNIEWKNTLNEKLEIANIFIENPEILLRN